MLPRNASLPSSNTDSSSLKTAAATTRKATAASGHYAFAEKVLALPEVKSLLMSTVNAHNAAVQKGKG